MISSFLILSHILPADKNHFEKSCRTQSHQSKTKGNISLIACLSYCVVAYSTAGQLAFAF